MQRPTNLIATNYEGEQKLFLIVKTIDNTFNEFIALIPAKNIEDARKRFTLRDNVDVIPVEEVDGFNVTLSLPSEK